MLGVKVPQESEVVFLLVMMKTQHSYLARSLPLEVEKDQRQLGHQMKLRNLIKLLQEEEEGEGEGEEAGVLVI